MLREVIDGPARKLDEQRRGPNDETPTRLSGGITSPLKRGKR
jgi:hypothetical protein